MNRQKQNDAADDCPVGQEIQVYLTIANGGTMRLDENIPATAPSYATVAPILHNHDHAQSADRGITLNNGAAA
jgi:hypothetical protein